MSEKPSYSEKEIGRDIGRRQYLKAGILAAGMSALGGCSFNQRPTNATPSGRSTPTETAQKPTETPRSPCRQLDTSMQHGILLLSKSDIERFESAQLGGWEIDIVQTTWGDDRSPYWDGTAPLWFGRSGTGSDLQQKKNSLRETFGETGRRWCPMYRISEGRSNYRPAVNGDLDEEWRQFAVDLVDMNMQDTILRPNPEFNLPWGRYPSDENGEPLPREEAGRVYADAFARCVKTMQSVPGADFTFLYNPAGRREGIMEDAWPLNSSFWPEGEDLPVVTPSAKAQRKGDYTPDEFSAMSRRKKASAARDMWENYQKPEYEMWQNFADSVGADIGNVEYGVLDAEAPLGIGDNKWYVDLSMEYMRENGWVFQAWWNTESGGDQPGGSRIWPSARSSLPWSRDTWIKNVLYDVANAASSCREENAS